jgi:murein DD-endopeptidase MepM/ murein hydrolase activator NlpD
MNQAVHEVDAPPCPGHDDCCRRCSPRHPVRAAAGGRGRHVGARGTRRRGAAGHGVRAAPAGESMLVVPMAPGSFRLTSDFGERKNPVTGAAEGHRGQDFGAPADTPIYAAVAGTVVRAGPAGGFGQWIVIDHQVGGQPVSTVYGHMWPDGVGVSEGEQVRPGQPIGRVGSNGQSTGPHLHFEVWEGGRSRGGRTKAAPSIPCRRGRSGNWAVLCRGYCLDDWGPVLLILVKVDRLRCSSLRPWSFQPEQRRRRNAPSGLASQTSGPDLSGRTGPGRSTSSATSPLGQERRSRRR